MIYKQEIKSHWEHQITSVFEEKPKTDMEIFLAIISLVMTDRFDGSIAELYSLVHNIQTFTEIINKFSGMTIKIPDREEFKTAITIAQSFYYKEVKKMKWDAIKKELPYGDDIPLRAGKGVAKLSKDIKKQILQLLTEEEEEEEA